MSGEKGSRIRATLDIVASVAMTVAALGIVWAVIGTRRAPPIQEGGEVQIPAEPVSFDPRTRLGQAEAPVVMLVFSDFECPYCGTFALNVLPSVKAEYLTPGLVQIGFRHLPLTTIHPGAQRAAEAAACAARQDRFWAFHDELFRNQRDLSETSIMLYARRVGLEESAFRTCLADEPDVVIAADIKLARSLNVESTPVVLVGLRTSENLVQVKSVVRGARPIDDFRAALNPLVEQQQRN